VAHYRKDCKKRWLASDAAVPNFPLAFADADMNAGSVIMMWSLTMGYEGCRQELEQIPSELGLSVEILCRTVPSWRGHL
jgi:hypothetical protein